MARKEIDRYLKSIIEKVPQELNDFIQSDKKKLLYYTGNWAADCQDNLTERQMNKVFKKIDKVRDDLIFMQKRLSDTKVSDGEGGHYVVTGFEYFAFKKV
tara:strand:- start:288 stop:587 length:300 start_codon:yes stop_codon:yes gene_type:complete